MATSLIGVADEVVFSDFNWFAPIINRSVAESWSVEETERTLITAERGIDSPEFGRTYLVFYNGARLGRLQVTKSLDMYAEEGPPILDPTVEDIRKYPFARAIINIDLLRFVPYEDALSIVRSIELNMGRWSDVKTADDNASAAASIALSGYLWEIVRAEDEDHVPSFYHVVDGPYERVRETTEHWKSNGLDGFDLERQRFEEGR